MSRIRSIHPGLWTDEDFVGMSCLARLMLIGIWNECDDAGIFAWNPLQLKMRILPMEAMDAGRLLEEMIEAGFILTYEVAGKRYGAVKNFMQFQHPNKPRMIYPATNSVLRFVGSPDVGSEEITEPIPNQCGSDTEPVSLGEERRGEEGREEVAPSGACASGDAPALKPEHFVESWNALAGKIGRPTIRALTPERRTKLKARIAGYSLDEFREVLGNVERSPFLRGEKAWSGCTFDWITKKANFQKILEGNYNG